jgi:hypothetical protein
MQVVTKHNELLSNDFINACRDYAYLMNRDFPERGVLKLVGDRYRLSGDLRTVLYRGISSGKRSAFRKSLLTENITGNDLMVDGYNVLFTLLNYRLGRIVFISTDQILRDAGSLHGRFRDEGTFMDCICLLLDYLAVKKPNRTDVYLDSPVSHSEKHAQMIRDRMRLDLPNGDCHVIKSADWALRQNRHAVIATSDTAIIEKSMTPVIDLPKAILQRVYQANFPELSLLLAADKGKDPIDKG